MDNVKTDDIKNSTALSPDPAEDLPPRRPKRILAAALAVLLVLGGAAGIYFGTSDKEDPGPVDEMSLYITEEPVIGCLEIADTGISIRTAPSADADEAPALPGLRKRTMSTRLCRRTVRSGTVSGRTAGSGKRTP